MSAPVKQRPTQELLREAWAYWKRSRETGDLLAEDQWLRAIDFLLDREDMPRR